MAYAIRSIIDHIDEYYVLYATRPSHGHDSAAICPDTEDELHEIAWQAAGTKLRWVSGDWQYEGQQRNSILQHAPDADVIISCDSDEIYSEKLIENIIRYSGSVTNSIPPFRYLRVPFIHYWRSFNKCILHDPAFPARVTFPRIDVKYGDSSWYPSSGVVNHMGYCQRAEMIRYKMKIHGHASEFRCTPDEYVDGIYLDENRWTDLHPIGSEYWNAETVNPLDYMPHWMLDHPFYGKEIIK